MSDFPPEYPPFTKDHHDRQPDGSPWEPNSILNHGGSCIVGPLGTFLAEPVWDREVIVYATLNQVDLIGSKVKQRSTPESVLMLTTACSQLDFDAVGSYSRPDVL